MATQRFLLVGIAVILVSSVFVQSEQIYTPFNRTAFPSGFVFGAASSAYQYEGAAKEGGKGPSIWDTFTHKFPGKISNGSTGDVADDFYHRYKMSTLISSHSRSTMGGVFVVERGRKSYIGGQVSYSDYEERDKVSLLDLHEIRKKLGLTDSIEFWYKVPGNEDYKIMENDKDVYEMELISLLLEAATPPDFLYNNGISGTPKYFIERLPSGIGIILPSVEVPLTAVLLGLLAAASSEWDGPRSQDEQLILSKAVCLRTAGQHSMMVKSEDMSINKLGNIKRGR